MPRIRSAAACTTCQRRKLRCDERLPSCLNCTKAKRYCDHTRPVRYRHAATKAQQVQREEALPAPREALEDATTARLFAHYVRNLAAWYDLSDGAMHFTKHIPQAALDRELLFYAIIAFAAVHLSVTSNAAAVRRTGERYTFHDVKMPTKSAG